MDKVTYWFILHMSGQYVAIPVLKFGTSVAWHLGNGLFEDYGNYEKSRLLESKEDALKMAKRLNLQHKQFIYTLKDGK